MALFFNYWISVSDCKIAVGELFTGWVYKRNLMAFFHLQDYSLKVSLK